MPIEKYYWHSERATAEARWWHRLELDALHESGHDIQHSKHITMDRSAAKTLSFEKGHGIDHVLIEPTRPVLGTQPVSQQFHY